MGSIRSHFREWFCRFSFAFFPSATSGSKMEYNNICLSNFENLHQPFWECSNTWLVPSNWKKPHWILWPILPELARSNMRLNRNISLHDNVFTRFHHQGDRANQRAAIVRPMATIKCDVAGNNKSAHQEGGVTSPSGNFLFLHRLQLNQLRVRGFRCCSFPFFFLHFLRRGCLCVSVCCEP